MPVKNLKKKVIARVKKALDKDKKSVVGKMTQRKKRDAKIMKAFKKKK